MAIIESWSREGWTDGFWVTFERCCDPDVLTMTRPAYQGNLWRQERLLEGMFPGRLFQADRKRRRLLNTGWSDKYDGSARQGWKAKKERIEEKIRRARGEDYDSGPGGNGNSNTSENNSGNSNTGGSVFGNNRHHNLKGKRGTWIDPKLVNRNPKTGKNSGLNAFSHGPTTSENLDADSLFVSPKGAENQGSWGGKGNPQNSNLNSS
jgi:hypothetical protein